MLRVLIALSVALGAVAAFALSLAGPAAAQTDIVDQIPAEVLAELEAREPDVVRGLRDGSITEIPGSVVDALPTGLADRIPSDLIAGTSGTFIAILAIVGLVALAGFFYGMVKSAIKAAMFFLVVAVVAGFFLFTL